MPIPPSHWLSDHLRDIRDALSELNQPTQQGARSLPVAAASDATATALPGQLRRTPGSIRQTVPGSRTPTNFEKLATAAESPIAGTILPPLGAVQVATDAAKNVSRGNYGKAALSAASTLPFLGIPGKLLGKGAQSAERFAILTAENAGGHAMSAAENEARLASLDAELAQRGYKPIPVTGSYKDPNTGEVLTENSRLVPNMSERAAKFVGKRFGQNGVITQGGYHDLVENKFYPSSGTAEATDLPYTQLPNGKRFSLNIDWNNAQAPQVSALPVPKNANPEVLRVADELRQGKDVANLPRVAKVDPAAGKKMAQAYEQLPKNDPSAKPAYDALNAEVDAQYKALQKAGYQFQFTDTDPYKSSKEMMQDVQQNRTLKVFKTQGDQTHPYMTNDQNDKFRAVHDLLAHAGEGHQFGPTGEENAYRVHASTLSPLAQRALATETRGQNSWVNFGPNADLPAAARPFAEQKAALFPEHLLGDYGTMQSPNELAAAKRQAFQQRVMETMPLKVKQGPSTLPPEDPAQLNELGQLFNTIRTGSPEEKAAAHARLDEIGAQGSTPYPQFERGNPPDEVKRRMGLLDEPMADSVVTRGPSLLPRSPAELGRASVQLADGRVFSGPTHFDAVLRAQKAGATDTDLTTAVDGFLGGDGKTFLDRNTVAQHLYPNDNMQPYVSSADGRYAKNQARLAEQRAQRAAARARDVAIAAQSAAPDAPAAPSVITAPNSGNVFDTSKLGLDVPAGVSTDRPPLKRPTRADFSSLKNVPRKMREVYTPNVEKALKDTPEAAGWYDMSQLRDAMKDLSPTGEDDFKKLMLFMGPTSIGTKVPDNLRQASMFYKLWKSGELNPEDLQNGTLDLPQGYSNRRQASVNAGISKILQNGNLDPFTTPKTYRYANQLAGDMWGGAALDMHVGRQVGQRGLMPSAKGELVPDTGFPTPSYSKDNPIVSSSPSDTQYAHIEDSLVRQAQNLGLTPAQYQALGWVGGGAQTGVADTRPLLDIFNSKLKATAQKYGYDSPMDAFQAFAKGQTPLWAMLPAAGMGGGLLYGNDQQR